MMLLPARSLHIFHAIAIVAEILVQKKKKKKNRGRTFVHAKKIVLKTIKTKKKNKKLLWSRDCWAGIQVRLASFLNKKFLISFTRSLENAVNRLVIVFRGLIQTMRPLIRSYFVIFLKSIYALHKASSIYTNCCCYFGALV